MSASILLTSRQGLATLSLRTGYLRPRGRRAEGHAGPTSNNPRELIRGRGRDHYYDARHSSVVVACAHIDQRFSVLRTLVRARLYSAGLATNNNTTKRTCLFL